MLTKVNIENSVSKLRFSKAVALFSILLLLSISCAKKKRETYTTRKAKESLALYTYPQKLDHKLRWI